MIIGPDGGILVCYLESSPLTKILLHRSGREFQKRLSVELEKMSEMAGDGSLEKSMRMARIKAESATLEHNVLVDCHRQNVEETEERIFEYSRLSEKRGKSDAFVS